MTSANEIGEDVNVEQSTRNMFKSLISSQEFDIEIQQNQKSKDKNNL